MASCCAAKEATTRTVAGMLNSSNMETPWSGGAQPHAETKRVLFFDIDGVIVREDSAPRSNIAHMGYAFIAKVISDPSYELEKADLWSEAIPEHFLDMVIEQRAAVKGKHPLVKIAMWRRMLGRENDTRDPAALVRIWYRFQRGYIERNWPAERYLMPGVGDLFKAIEQMKRKDPDLLVVAATANEQLQAEWLLGYAGVLGAFDEVLGYKLDEKDPPRDKVEMLRRFLAERGDVEKSVMVGDGIPDMRAGAANGAVCIGVTADERALREAGAAHYFAEGEYHALQECLGKLLQPHSL